MKVITFKFLKTTLQSNRTVYVYMKFAIYLFNRVFLARNLSDFSDNLDVILQLHLQALCKRKLRVCHNRKTKLLGQLERITHKYCQFLKK